MTSRWPEPFNPRNPALATMSMAPTGPAMTLFNVQRQAGQAMGVAVLATVLAATRPVPPDLGGYHLAFVVAAMAPAAADSG